MSQSSAEADRLFSSALRAISANRVRLAEASALLFIAWASTHTLARLSGTALWLPQEWRVSVEAATGMITGTLFFATRYAVDIWNPKPRETGDNSPSPATATATTVITDSYADETVAGKHTHTSAVAKTETIQSPGIPLGSSEGAAAMKSWHRKTLISFGVSLVLFLASMYCLSKFFSLRNKCVVSFDAGDWVHEQIVMEKRFPTSAPTYMNSSQTYNIYHPDFVNTEQNLIYLPEHLPKQLDDYLTELGEEYHTDGLQYALQNEPDFVIDTIATAGREAKNDTTRNFLILNLLTLSFAAIGLAGSADVISSITDLLSP